MTPEELLIPRYKVVDDYPNNPANVGDIFTKIDGIQNYTNGSIALGIYTLEKYPNLFKLLAWYDDRKEEDLPPYIKGMAGYFSVKWTIVDKRTYCTDNNTGHRLWFTDYLPCTEEEYEAFLKAKPQL